MDSMTATENDKRDIDGIEVIPGSSSASTALSYALIRQSNRSKQETARPLSKYRPPSPPTRSSYMKARLSKSYELAAQHSEASTVQMHNHSSKTPPIDRKSFQRVSSYKQKPATIPERKDDATKKVATVKEPESPSNKTATTQDFTAIDQSNSAPTKTTKQKKMTRALKILRRKASLKKDLSSIEKALEPSRAPEVGKEYASTGVVANEAKASAADVPAKTREEGLDSNEAKFLAADVPADTREDGLHFNGVGHAELEKKVRKYTVRSIELLESVDKSVKQSPSKRGKNKELDSRLALRDITRAKLAIGYAIEARRLNDLVEASKAKKGSRSRSSSPKRTVSPLTSVLGEIGKEPPEGTVSETKSVSTKKEAGPEASTLIGHSSRMEGESNGTSSKYDIQAVTSPQGQGKTTQLDRSLPGVVDERTLSPLSHVLGELGSDPPTSSNDKTSEASSSLKDSNVPERELQGIIFPPSLAKSEILERVQSEAMYPPPSYCGDDEIEPILSVKTPQLASTSKNSTSGLLTCGRGLGDIEVTDEALHAADITNIVHTLSNDSNEIERVLAVAEQDRLIQEIDHFPSTFWALMCHPVMDGVEKLRLQREESIARARQVLDSLRSQTMAATTNSSYREATVHKASSVSSYNVNRFCCPATLPDELLQEYKSSLLSDSDSSDDDDESEFTDVLEFLTIPRIVKLESFENRDRYLVNERSFGSTTEASNSEAQKMLEVTEQSSVDSCSSEDSDEDTSLGSVKQIVMLEDGYESTVSRRTNSSASGLHEEIEMFEEITVTNSLVDGTDSEGSLDSESSDSSSGTVEYLDGTDQSASTSGFVSNSSRSEVQEEIEVFDDDDDSEISEQLTNSSTNGEPSCINSGSCLTTEHNPTNEDKSSPKRNLGFCA